MALLIPLGGMLQAQQGPYHFGPGFNARECDELLRLNFAFLDTAKESRFENFLAGYQFLYRTPNTGLDNACDLWLRSDSAVVIALRGTTADPKSILADFYCAMAPAKGELILPGNDTLKYQLAAEKRAALHAGFLIGFGFIAKDILPKLDSLYRKGYHNFLVTGHSQGGALCYYVSAWLMYLRKNGIYPRLGVKTYASAAPKTGNMYFAYDYDNTAHAEWTFSIINTADPVPEFPFTTQQVDRDMNEPNPMLNLMKRFDASSSQQANEAKKAFDKMLKSAARSSGTYQSFFGAYIKRLIDQLKPGISIPVTVNSTYFVRPGIAISLLVNDTYLKHYENNNDGPYYHHGVNAYRFLLRQYYDELGPLKE